VKGERVDGRKRRKVREWEKGEVTGGGKGKSGGEEKGVRVEGGKMWAELRVGKKRMG
jgi:hypothetical protein